MKGKTLNSINTSIFFLRVIISRRNFFYFSQLFALNHFCLYSILENSLGKTICNTQIHLALVNRWYFHENCVNLFSHHDHLHVRIFLSQFDIIYFITKLGKISKWKIYHINFRHIWIKFNWNKELFHLTFHPNFFN